MRAFDVIVVGIGGMGSAAIHQLAKRGARVLGIEQFDLGHGMGSSHSPTRAFRKAYFTDPAYVALAQRAHMLWQGLEEESEERLLLITGGLFVGPEPSPVIRGVRDSAERHGLSHELFDSSELAKRYPALTASEDAVAILEHEAGVLLADRSVDAQLRLALRTGAEVRASEAVLGFESQASGVVVRTSRGSYAASTVALTTGPWLPGIWEPETSADPSVFLPLVVERQVELWFAPDSPEYFGPERLPVFNYVFSEPGLSYYGIPMLSEAGVKAARHYGGATVTPDTIDRRVSALDEADVRGFLSRYLPRLDKPAVSGRVCMNTNTPDRHFVVGRHPRHENIVVAGGFSGHGFKFAPVIGEIVADLALTAGTVHPIARFSPARFERSEVSSAKPSG
jgi:sarcosine oxidase